GTAQTDFGPQPYFAMELVGGVSLLEYATQCGLDTKQRIELMIEICDAVDYAHRSGIIHRDLKPRNILVDQSGQPKILDFGVARVIDNELNVTQQTRLGDLIGTLEYMSPEQSMADPQMIDARSDVYSLGILLYELLAGCRPYSIDRDLPDAARVIREQDPRPLSSVNRGCGGDIETIVAKALEKEKARRYGSASELSADLRRFLSDQPILAQPASALYRGRKFVRRHRGLVSASAVVFFVLLAGIIVSTRQAILASRERDRALRAEQIARAVNSFLQDDMLAQAGSRAQASAHSQPDPNLTVRTALDRAAGRIAGKFDSQPAVEAAVHRTIGLAYLDLNLFSSAQPQLERAVELRKNALGPDDPDTLASMNELGVLYNLEAKYGAAEALLSQVLEARRRVLGKDHKDTLTTMAALGTVISYAGDDTRAARVLSEALQADLRVLGQDDPVTLSLMDNLCVAYLRLGEFDAAEKLSRREVDGHRRVFGAGHPDTLNSMQNLATVYRAESKYAESDSLTNAVLDARRRALGDDHWETENTRYNLAISYSAQGRYAEAEPLFIQSANSLSRTLGPEHPLVLKVLYQMGQLYCRQRNFAKAEPIFFHVLQIRRKIYSVDSPYLAEILAAYGRVKFEQNSYPESEKLAGEALQIRELKTPDAWQRYFAESLLGASLWRMGQYSEARPLLTSGYQGMLDRQSSIAGEERPALQLARSWMNHS
ncbi:MAG: serine/threonine protein kinase, partial [Acidobacteria bacterium]|nr:serine/threonine protein kinase [Acidobacteriota bacterium]